MACFLCYVDREGDINVAAVAEGRGTTSSALPTPQDRGFISRPDPFEA